MKNGIDCLIERSNGESVGEREKEREREREGERERVRNGGNSGEKKIEKLPLNSQIFGSPIPTLPIFSVSEEYFSWSWNSRI